MNRPILLQLCDLPAEAAATLAHLFEVERLPAPELPGSWLAAGRRAVRAIATGGQTGAPTRLIEQLPDLGIIAVNGVGVDKIDLDLARRRGIRVTTTPGVLTDDVADLAVGLVIALLRGVVAADAHVRSGRWLAGPAPLARSVSGRRFGIVGLGRIGGAIARRLIAFGPVAYTGRRRQPVSYDYHPDVQSLAAAVDILVVAVPGSPETEQLIDAATIDALGPDGYLVNIARGSVVDEAALIAALADGRIAGAALDVFADEPRVPAALIASPRTLLAPHVGSATVETRARMGELVVANLRAFLMGEPLPTALV